MRQEVLDFKDKVVEEFGKGKWCVGDVIDMADELRPVYFANYSNGGFHSGLGTWLTKSVDTQFGDHVLRKDLDASKKRDRGLYWFEEVGAEDRVDFEKIHMVARKGYVLKSLLHSGSVSIKEVLEVADEVNKEAERLFELGKKYDVPKESCRNLVIAMKREQAGDNGQWPIS